jgi:chemotaxis family two-component system response regulator Rcp1
LSTAIEILLIEDNPAHVKLTKVALQGMNVPNTVQVVSDGVEGLHYLRKEGKYADASRPNLILLDLNLPRKNGKELLTEIKQDDNLKSIPVVVLTMSEDEQDILATYNSHANSYITKPTDIEGFVDVVRSLEQFWFTIVKLPQT